MKISKDADGRHGQIVVVEELPDNIYSIRFILESLGYKVASVPFRSGYIDEIGKLAPELVIVDMMIPSRAGLTVVAELNRSKLKSVPTIAITADAVALEETELLEAGFREVLNKPYTVTQLQEKLAKFVS